MVEKKPWHEEDDTLYQEIKSDQKDYEELELAKFKGVFRKDNGTPAKNNLDLGRNCPRCAGLLALKEIRESGAVQLFCRSCGIEVFAEGIDYNDPLSDRLYSEIPHNVIQYWENFRKNRKKRNETP